MIKITYDYQIFNSQKYGGISRYFCELIAHISKISNIEVKVVAGFYINEYLRQCNSDLIMGMPRKPVPKIERTVQRINARLSQAWMKLGDRPDIVHETYYSPRQTASKFCPSVITVYDMIYEKFSYLFSEREKNFSLIKAKAIKQADHIICISHKTKKDLIEILNIEPQKVSVIYLGYSFRIESSISLHALINDLQHPYILYVGTRGAYKNFDCLLKAYASRSALNKNFKLVCLGAKGFSGDELNKIQELGLSKAQVKYVSGDNQTLAQLYKQASVFVYPSLYEGFGMPPLEAMSFDCPVACSNTGSLPEVVGNAAEFFDPYEVDSIADALEKVLFSSEKAKNLVELGRERIKQFSWETCAKQTSLIYSSLL